MFSFYPVNEEYFLPVEIFINSLLFFSSGTKHFLLMCNVRAEDSGEIKFVGRNVECAAYLGVEGIK